MQRLIYYLSKDLVDVKTRYSQVEQTTLALQAVAKKLCPYFQAHQVVMLMNLPLRVIIHKLDLSRWLVKWVIELSEYDTIKTKVIPQRENLG